MLFKCVIVFVSIFHIAIGGNVYVENVDKENVDGEKQYLLVKTIGEYEVKRSKDYSDEVPREVARCLETPGLIGPCKALQPNGHLMKALAESLTLEDAEAMLTCLIDKTE
eukprot:TRINITY_DN0_c532_g1_i1.p1 TRINITY_DN0_c532_g1~~TRINITY_DN0_c532_g1_i1.p1  ORF type:complete len:110 (-),score=15.08 TRINITY_DN0_c532_g1_i1:557-886(-)